MWVNANKFMAEAMKIAALKGECMKKGKKWEKNERSKNLPTVNLIKNHVTYNLHPKPPSSLLSLSL